MKLPTSFLGLLLLALALFLPFERLPSYEWYGLTIRLSSLAICAFVIYLPVMLREKQLGPLSKIDWAILVLLGAVAISLVDAVDPHRGVLTFLILGFVALGYLLVSRVARIDTLRTQAINTVILVALLTALFGFFQFFGDAFGLPVTVTGLTERYTDAVFGFSRLQSVGVEPLYYANFLLLPIFILVGRYIFNDATRRQTLIVLGFLTGALVLTLSRGAFLACLLGLVVMAAVALWQKVEGRKLGAVAVTLLLGIIGAFVCIAAVSGIQGIKTFGQQSIVVEAPVQSSTTSRLDHARQAWQIFLANPINGVGFGSYDAASRLIDTPEEKGRQIVNNQYLETLAETGLIGFAALLTLGLLAIGKLIFLVHQRPNGLAVALLATLLGIIVQYNFFSTLYVLYVWVVLGLIDSLPDSSRSRSESSNI